LEDSEKDYHVRAAVETHSGAEVFTLPASFFQWKSALLIVKPAMLIGWHRKAFRLFWKWKSRRVGRPRLPTELQHMIARMVLDNPTWGEERIADELWLKLGISVSPRTVRAYSPTEDKSRHPRLASQNWKTFVRNHARVLLACDFMVAVTARFRILYIFLVMEVGSRRILHCNVTARPTADWTTQQLRDAIPSDHTYRFLLHDRHATFSSRLSTWFCPVLDCWPAGITQCEMSFANESERRHTLIR
jgi:hypothetical protein